MVRAALDFANSPDALTTPERMWLVKEAADADDETRRCVRNADSYGWDEMLAALVMKGAMAVHGKAVFFTEMGLSDAYKAYRVMAGVEEEVR